MARSTSYVLTRLSDKTAHQQIIFVTTEYLLHVCIRLLTFFLVIFSARGSCWHNERCGDAEKSKESVAPRCYKHGRDPLPVHPGRRGLLPYGPLSKHPQHGWSAECLVSYFICLSASTCVDVTLP
jgi:hypothetical protein